MFWKKSKDKLSPAQQNTTKSSTTTIYRIDGGATSTGSAVTSYNSKMKSSSKGSSSKTTITISTKQTATETKSYSEVRTITARQPLTSSKWTSSSSTATNQTQKAILPRQRTEPSIVRKIDATPFNTKYESPFRNANLPPLKTLPLPASSTTTTTFEYQSPYRNTNATASMRENKTTSIAPSRTITSTATALLASAPKTKTNTTIWNPLSSLQNQSQSAFTQSWNNVSSLPAKPYKEPPTVVKAEPRVPTVKPPPPPVAVVKKKKQSPGVVYIFHNDKFDSPDKEFRVGSIEDVRVLKKTFQSLKMQVNLYENLTVREVDNAVRKIETKDFGNVSCIVIVILTHGTRYATVAAKDGSYSVDDNVLFPILRNRSLRTKPKLLFIQACKGAMETGGFHKDAIQPNGPPDEILKCYSTFEGYVAYRTEKGSLFIQALCELIQLYGKTTNIKDIMDLVIKRVKERSESKQIPSYETTLTEPYIFGEYV